MCSDASLAIGPRFGHGYYGYGYGGFANGLQFPTSLPNAWPPSWPHVRVIIIAMHHPTMLYLHVMTYLYRQCIQHIQRMMLKMMVVVHLLDWYDHRSIMQQIMQTSMGESLNELNNTDELGLCMVFNAQRCTSISSHRLSRKPFIMYP